MIKGIIFDLDGTLANTLPLCIKAFRQSVQPLAAKVISDEDIIATFGPSEEGTIMALIPDHYEEGIAGYLHYYEQLHAMCPQPFDGMYELLTYLREHSVRIAMVTGKGKFSTAISLKQFGLTYFFEVIETGSPSGPQKVEGIQAVLDQWKELEKEEVIYVGDAPSDITASRKAGIPVIGAAWAETAEAENLVKLDPDRVFHTIKDFAEWIRSEVEPHTLPGNAAPRSLPSDRPSEHSS